jgi:hypothetical protein
MTSYLSGRAYHNPEHADQGPRSWFPNVARRFDRSPRPPHLSVGERHLRALRLVHDALTDLGVVETVRRLDRWMLTRAAMAARYFDIEGLADLFDRAEGSVGSTMDAKDFDDEYRRRFGVGTAISDAVARKMTESPTDFPE